ncbi:MAG: hypothetical protein QOD35_137 [Nocardioidaceae bacterium]|nr:hypothetical protein [Nocardioidaceae bacterium]
MRQLTTSVALVATAAISTFGVVAVAPSASADTPGCVTRAEYRQVQTGMHIKRVHTIFDTRGAAYGTSGLKRIYRVCNTYAEKYSVVVSYMDMPPMMVSSKTWRLR